MDELTIERVVEQAVRNRDQTICDLKRTIEQQSALIEDQLMAIEIGNGTNDFLRAQQQVLLAVLNTYRRSRWPWIRWMAEQMHEEMRLGTIEHIGRTTGERG